MRLNMSDGNLGSITRQGNFLRINNAFVEEVSFSGRNTGFIIVSYSVPRPNGITTIESLRLNVGNNTLILNAFGLPACFCDIRQGMWVNVTFSQRMTRSIPCLLYTSHLGGWVSIIGYIFSLLALSTSFWANTLNLRDVVNEQTKWGVKVSWLAASLPCLIIALIGVESFVGFTRLAGVIQVLTGIGIIIAYNRSRKRKGSSLICGKLGTLPFQIIVIIGSLVSTIGSLLSVS